MGRVTQQIEMKAKRREVVTPARYLRMTKEERDNVESVRILPPQIGRRGFGRLMVLFRDPIWRVG